MNIFNNITNFFRNRNKFNTAFYSNWVSTASAYDPNGITYLDKGYNFNGVVYSIINKQAIKTASIPLIIKKIKDEQSKQKLVNLHKSTNGNFSPLQRIKKNRLEVKAFEEEILSLPLERPNITQTWAEFHALFKTYLKTNGNFYIYEESAEEGLNSGKPRAVYILPAYNVKIVLKANANLLNSDESPIKEYMLIEGNNYVTFPSEKVYHIKYANPNYSEDGEQLYGQAPLRAVLRNLQSSNSALDNNIKTLLNSGAFGFIFGKGAVLNEGQTVSIKERLKEMDKDPERLGKLGALSAEIGFQRISLTTDELKPFEYLKYDEKQICNALGWSDKLLNNDDGAKYDNVNQFRKQIVVDDIKPDLLLLEQGFWKPFLAKFKGYEDVVVEYDISELPEMQDDMVLLAEWTTKLSDRGYLNGDEVREVFNFPSTELPEHKIYTVAADVLTLEEAIDSSFNVEDNKQ